MYRFEQERKSKVHAVAWLVLDRLEWGDCGTQLWNWKICGAAGDKRKWIIKGRGLFNKDLWLGRVYREKHLGTKDWLKN